jgi:UTP:GlnB (protein PII) uridylyltransferase
MIEFNYSVQAEEIVISLKTDITKIGTFHKMVAVIYKFDWDIQFGDIQTIEIDGKKYALDLIKLKIEEKKNIQSTIELGYLMESIFSSNEDILPDLYKEIFSKKVKKLSYFKDRAELIIEDDLNLNQTVLYIEAESAKGLLFYLTKVFLELEIDIVSAKIETEPNTQIAMDTFYLLDKDGHMFGDTPKSKELKDLIFKNL